MHCMCSRPLVGSIIIFMVGICVMNDLSAEAMARSVMISL